MDLLKKYESCNLCPNHCAVDRRNGPSGICRMTDRIKIAWSGLHRGEEPPISGEKGSGMIFFSGCPLHCAYCQNRQISGSDGENSGIYVSIEELSLMMLSLERMGAATLNLVTGTHFIPSIILALENARKEGFSLPVVWNSSGYEDVEALKLIDPYVDIYLLDCKSLSSNVSRVFCGRASYSRVIRPVMEFVASTHPVTDLEKAMRGVVLRHLVFPGCLEQSLSFLEYYAGHYKDRFLLSFMVQFVPPLGNLEFTKITEEEYQRVLDKFDELGIEEGFIQETGDEILWIPDFTRDNPFPEGFADPNPYFIELKRNSGI